MDVPERQGDLHRQREQRQSRASLQLRPEPPHHYKLAMMLLRHLAAYDTAVEMKRRIPTPGVLGFEVLIGGFGDGVLARHARCYVRVHPNFVRPPACAEDEG